MIKILFITGVLFLAERLFYFIRHVFYLSKNKLKKIDENITADNAFKKAKERGIWNIFLVLIHIAWCFCGILTKFYPLFIFSFIIEFLMPTMLFYVGKLNDNIADIVNRSMAICIICVILYKLGIIIF